MSAPTEETVAAKVREAVETIDIAKFEPVCRGFVDDVYERLLGTVQDYLADNLTWNLRADFDYASSRARHYEMQLIEVDNLLTPFGGREERMKRIAELLELEKQHYATLAKARGETA